MQRPSRTSPSSTATPTSGQTPPTAPSTAGSPSPEATARNRRLGYLLPVLVFVVPLILVVIVQVTGIADAVSRALASLW